MKNYVLAGMIALGLTCSMSVMATDASSAETKAVTTATVAPKSDTINLNTADKKQLAHAVKGIGKRRALAIVKYRKEHGNFKSVDDLANVPGIGKKFVEKNHKQLTATFVTE